MPHCARASRRRLALSGELSESFSLMLVAQNCIHGITMSLLCSHTAPGCASVSICIRFLRSSSYGFKVAP